MKYFEALFAAGKRKESF